MTTVTEAAKRLGINYSPLERVDLATLKEDTALAQQLARQLLVEAKRIAPGASWTLEGLLDVLEAAVHGRIADVGQIVEGRYLRKRVRELCAYAERYGEPFALMVLKLAKEPREGLYGSLAELLVTKLRPTDMITVYRRRYAILLPRMQPRALPSLEERMRQVAHTLAAAPVIESVVATMFPVPGLEDTQTILDWLEDQLRLDA